MKFFILFIVSVVVLRAECSFTGVQNIIDREYVSTYEDGFGRLALVPLADGGFYVSYDPNQCSGLGDDQVCSRLGFAACRSLLEEIPNASGFADRPRRFRVTTDIFLDIGGMPGPDDLTAIPIYAVKLNQTGALTSRVSMTPKGQSRQKKRYDVVRGFVGGADGPALESCY